MHHLSALDAIFLQLETPDVPTHVASLVLYEKPAGVRGSVFPRIRKHIVSRLHLAPLFTRRLAFMPLDLVNPIWVDAEHFDPDNHLIHIVLPKPGTMEQLQERVAELHERLLDRDKPLWEFYVIEGLWNGQFAIYSKIHHAALDGQGGVALAQAVLDTDPVPRKVRPAEKHEPQLPPSTAKMLSAAFRHTIAQYGKIVRAVPDAVRLAGAGVSALTSSQAKAAGAPSEQGTGVAGETLFKPGDSPEKVAKSLLKKIPGGISLGPRTSLNVAISGKRSFIGIRLPLDETKVIARFFDTKLNDAVMAVVAGALRRYFANNKAVLAKAMIAGVPASLRAPGDTSQGNQVTMMLVNLATNVADPVKRTRAIIKASTKAKMLTGGMKSLIPSDMPSLGIPWLMSAITPLYKTAVSTNRIPVIANVVISNVPGPQVPLYMAGAKMTTYFPVSIVTHGLALNITIQSYNGSLDYGLIACRETVPDLDRFAQAMRDAHLELLALATAKASAKSKPVARKPTWSKMTRSTGKKSLTQVKKAVAKPRINTASTSKSTRKKRA